MTSLHTPVSSAVSALVILQDGKPVTTSQIVADVFSKNHRDVLRSISNITESPVYLERNQRNFALVDYVDAKGERRPMYKMDRQGFEILAMGFTGDEALRWKFKYSDAFAAMESALANPQPWPDPALYGHVHPELAIVEKMAGQVSQAFFDYLTDYRRRRFYVPPRKRE